MRNILNQSHDQARMFRDELEATKKKAAERLAKNRKQYEERLRVEKAVAQRAATALTQLETVSHTDAAELLSSLMARQEQDEKVTSLSKEITEAMAKVEEQRSVKEKLQQQYDSLRGQYTHREEQNKRKIASLSRDLKEESRQLKAALAEGDELRDAASQLHAARAPQSLAAFRLLWPAARPAHRVPCLRPSAVRDGLQPAAQLGHVPRHEHGLHVLRALLPAPASQICSRALSPVHAARAPQSLAAFRLPARSPPRAPCALLATLGSPRRPSTSRSAGTRPASQTCTPCFTCAAPRPRASQICSRALSPACCTRTAIARHVPRLLWPAARPAHRVPCLRPSPVRDGLQPAA